jgi:hypothetical protein
VPVSHYFVSFCKRAVRDELVNMEDVDENCQRQRRHNVFWTGGRDGDGSAVHNWELFGRHTHCDRAWHSRRDPHFKPALVWYATTSGDRQWHPRQPQSNTISNPPSTSVFVWLGMLLGDCKRPAHSPRLLRVVWLLYRPRSSYHLSPLYSGQETAHSIQGPSHETPVHPQSSRLFFFLEFLWLAILFHLYNQKLRPDGTVDPVLLGSSTEARILSLTLSQFSASRIQVQRPPLASVHQHNTH